MINALHNRHAGLQIYFSVLCSITSVLFLLSCATTPGTRDIRDAEVRYKIGVSHLNKNQLKEAYIKFQEAIRLNPRDKLSMNALGYISARFKEYDKAISYYKSAISLDPDYSDAMNNLGVTYMEIELLKKRTQIWGMLYTGRVTLPELKKPLKKHWQNIRLLIILRMSLALYMPGRAGLNPR
jgi:tetratricopeptide (TPR) repeat protein